MSTPEQIQREIEQTRATLSTDVDRLGAKVSPTQTARRRVDRMKGGAMSMRDRVMGTSHDPGALTSGAESAKQAVSSAATSIGDAASQAPQSVRQKTQGNPLAAGMIAFGVGWLAASLVPASQPEQDVAKVAEDRAGALADTLKGTAQEVAGNLQEPLQQSVESVKSTAAQAANETAEHAKSAAGDVKQPLQQ
ncbi:MAG: hypothetical protein JWO57_3669 [Pseudonocardiales bacterium]|nr:hypothetical protein [Pseudonocardiales bacterium]